jgi:hypothetical protein
LKPLRIKLIWKPVLISLKPILLAAALPSLRHDHEFSASGLIIIELSIGQGGRRMQPIHTAQNPDKPRYVAGAIGPTNANRVYVARCKQPGYRAVYL